MDKIQAELDAMELVSYTNDITEDMQNILVEKITSADNAMIECNSTWCDKIITEDGGYYEDDLIEFAKDLGVIAEDLPEDEDVADLIEVTGLKYTEVVAHIHEVEDIEYNRETREIKQLGTFQTEYTLYCSKSCAVSSRRTFLIMKANHEKKEG